MYAEIVEAVWKNAPWYLAGTGVLALGVLLLVDDIYDFPDFSRADHPSPVHHYQYGLLLIICAVLLFCVGICLTKEVLNKNGSSAP